MLAAVFCAVRNWLRRTSWLVVQSSRLQWPVGLGKALVKTGCPVEEKGCYVAIKNKNIIFFAWGVRDPPQISSFLNARQIVPEAKQSSWKDILQLRNF